MQKPGGLVIGVGINHPSFYIHPIMYYCGCIIMGLHYVANKYIISTKCKQSKPNLYFAKAVE